MKFLSVRNLPQTVSKVRKYKFLLYFHLLWEIRCFIYANNPQDEKSNEKGYVFVHT